MTAAGDRNSSREWSLEEIADLELCASIGDPAAEIAKYLERTEAEIRKKADELGVKLGWPAPLRHSPS